MGSLWLGWSSEYEGAPWYVPALSGVLIGAGIILIFSSVFGAFVLPLARLNKRLTNFRLGYFLSAYQSYLIDTYMMYAASASAGNTIIRSAVGAAYPLSTVQMYHKVGLTSLPPFSSQLFFISP